MFVNQGAQLHGQLILHAVVNKLSLLFSLQDVGRRQEREMFGNVRLGGADQFHNVVHRLRLVTHRLQYSKAHGLTQQTEPQRDLVQLVLGQEMVGLCL